MNSSVNKNKLTLKGINSAISQELKIPNSTVKKITDCLFYKVFPNAFNEGVRCVINRFGTFDSKNLVSRMGVDPNTREYRRYPAKRKLKLKVSASFYKKK